MKASTAFELVLLALLAAVSVGSSFAEDNSTANVTTTNITTENIVNQDISKGVSQAVTINEISYAAPSPERENLNGEWVEITNKGSAAQDMSGWKLFDKGNHTYTFKTFNLKAGASVKVHTGQGEDTASDLYWKNKSPIWNNGGDEATLVDSTSTVVSSYKYSKEGKTKEA